MANDKDKITGTKSVNIKPNTLDLTEDIFQQKLYESVIADKYRSSLTPAYKAGSLDPDEWNSLEGPYNDYATREELIKKRDNDQSFGEAFGIGLLNLAPNIFLNVAESVGELGDIQAHIDTFTGRGNDYNNWLTEWARDKKNPFGEIYTAESNDPGEADWWLKNGFGVAESALAFAATGAGVGSLAGKATMGLAKALEAGRTGQTIARLGAATITNSSLAYAEGVMGGATVYKDAYIDAVNEGKSSIEANEIAAAAAAKTVRINTVINSVLNIPQTKSLFRDINYFNSLDDALKRVEGETTEQYLKRLKDLPESKKALSSVFSKENLLNKGAEMGSESLEEVVNQISEDEGTYQYLRALGKVSDKDIFTRLGETLKKEETWSAAFWGAVGGLAQPALMNMVPKKVKEYDDEGNVIKEKWTTVGKFNTEQEDKIYRDQVDGLVTHLGAIQEAKTNLAAAAKSGDEKAYKKAQDDLFALESYQAVVKGISEQTKESYREIQMLSEEEAANQGFNVDPNSDDYYKHLAARKINDIDHLTKKYTELNKKYNYDKLDADLYGYHNELFSRYIDIYNNRQRVDKFDMDLVKAESDYKANRARRGMDYTISAALDVQTANKAVKKEFDEVDRQEESLRKQQESGAPLTIAQKKLFGPTYDDVFRALRDRKVALKEKSKEVTAALDGAFELFKQANFEEGKTDAEYSKEFNKAINDNEAETEDLAIGKFMLDDSRNELNQREETYNKMLTDEGKDMFKEQKKKAQEELKAKMEAARKTEEDIKAKEKAKEKETKEKIKKSVTPTKTTTEPKGKAEDFEANPFADYTPEDEVEGGDETPPVQGVAELFGKPGEEGKKEEPPVKDTGSNINTGLANNLDELEDGEFYGKGQGETLPARIESVQKFANNPEGESGGLVATDGNTVLFENNKLVMATTAIAYGTSKDFEEYNIDNTNRTRTISNKLSEELTSNVVLSKTNTLPGDKVTIKVLSSLDFKPYTLSKDWTALDVDGNPIKTYPKGTLIDYNTLSSLGNNYVPIGIFNASNELIGYLHDMSYMRDERVVSPEADRKALNMFREYIINNGGEVISNIETTSLGTLSINLKYTENSPIERINGSTNRVSSEAIPTLELAVAKTQTTAFTQDNENSLVTGTKNNFTNSPLIPGAIYAIAEGKGGQKLLCPIDTMQLGDIKEVADTLYTVITAYYKANKTAEDIEVLTKLFGQSYRGKDIENFIRLFIKSKDLTKVVDPRTNMITTEFEEDRFYFDVRPEGNEIQFGKSGTKVFSLNTNQKTEATKSIKQLLYSALQNSYVSISLARKTEFANKPVSYNLLDAEGKVIRKSHSNYNDFIKSYTFTNLNEYQINYKKDGKQVTENVIFDNPVISINPIVANKPKEVTAAKTEPVSDKKDDIERRRQEDLKVAKQNFEYLNKEYIPKLEENTNILKEQYNFQKSELLKNTGNLEFVESKYGKTFEDWIPLQIKWLKENKSHLLVDSRNSESRDYKTLKLLQEKNKANSEINAKYDAELAALEGKAVASKTETKTEPKVQKTKRGVKGFDKIKKKPKDESDLSLRPVVNEGVDYVFKVTSKVINNIGKVNSWFKQLKDTDQFWNKVQKDLAIPSDQIELLKNSKGNTIEEKLLSFATTYSYAVEISVALAGKPIAEDGEYYNEDGIRITYEEYERLSEGAPSNYYARLTVPGGVDYTENEIATPAITPKIQGHGMFSTDKGIGWFRSDDQVEGGKYYPGGVFEGEMIEPTTEGGTPTKTRRILEVQSDLFQKGRDLRDLTNYAFNTYFLTNKNNKWQIVKQLNTGRIENTEFEYETIEEAKNKLKELNPISEKQLQNQFLQLLNKGNNWVTFFVKSIIQDSAKKGYETVLFPGGDTASKIEGHTTLTDEIKRLENIINLPEQTTLDPLRNQLNAINAKIDELNATKEIKKYAFDNTTGNISVDGEVVYNAKKKGKYFNYTNVATGETTTTEFTQITPLLQALNKADYGEGLLKEVKDSRLNELLRDKKAFIEEIEEVKSTLDLKVKNAQTRLAELQSESISKIKPIYNFYENTVANVLKKQGYSPVVITDEHGNKWYQVTIKESDKSQIDLSLRPLTTDELTRVNQSKAGLFNPGKIDIYQQTEVLNYLVATVANDITANGSTFEESINNIKEFFEYNEEENSDLTPILEVWDKFSESTKSKVEALSKVTDEDFFSESEEESRSSDDTNNTKVTENYSEDKWFTVDANKSISGRLRRLLISIQDGENYLGLPKYKPVSEVMSKLQSILVNAPNADYAYFISKLREHQATNTWISNVVDILEGTDIYNKEKFTNSDGLYDQKDHAAAIEKFEATKTQLQNEFAIWAYKHFVEKYTNVISRNKNNNQVTVKTISANQNDNVKMIISSWIENLKLTDLVTTNDKGNLVIDADKKKAILDKFKAITEDLKEKKYSPTSIKFQAELSDLLSLVGIDLDTDLLDKLAQALNSGTLNKKYTLANFTEAGGIFKTMFDKLASNKIATDAFEVIEDEETQMDETFNVSNPLTGNSGVNTLARWLATQVDDIISNSFYDNGKTIWSYSVNKHISSQIYKLKNDKNFVEFLRSCDFQSGSYVLDMLSDATEGIAGKDLFKQWFKMAYVSSIKKSKSNAKELEYMEEPELEKTRLAFFMNQGDKDVKTGLRKVRHVSLTTSDKKNLAVFNMLAFTPNLTFDTTTGKFTGFNEETVQELINLIQGEYTRIYNYQNTIKADPSIKGNLADDFVKGAEIFYLFPVLNDKTNNIIWDANGNLNRFDSKVSEEVGKILSREAAKLVENKIATWRNLGIDNFLDSTYIKKIVNPSLPDALKNNKEAMLAFAAADYELNQVRNNLNLYQLFSGDIAYYYKKESTTESNDTIGIVKDTLTNLGKRLAAQIAPGNSLGNTNSTDVAGVNGHEYIQVIAKDQEVVSNNLKYLKTILDKTGLKPYESVEPTDAQEYTTLKEHLYVMFHEGKIPDDVYKSIMKRLETQGDNIVLDSKELGFVLQPVKPVYFDTKQSTYSSSTTNNKTNTLRPIYVKTSSIPLIPQFTKGMELDKLRKSMEDLQKSENKLVRLVFKSGIKVGKPANIAAIFTGEDKRSIKDNIKFSPDNYLVLNRDGFRIQQEIPFDAGKAKINRGSQEVKILFTDILDVRGFNYGELNNVDGRTLQKEYKAKMARLYKIGQEKLLDELDAKKDADGKVVSYNKEKLVELLKEEIKARGLSPDYYDALKLVDVGVDKVFTTPLMFLNRSNKFESLIISLVDNRVRKQKNPGWSSPLVSSAGIMTLAEAKEGEFNENSVVLLDGFDLSQGLKSMRVEDGKVMPAQILAPFKFRDNKGNLLRIKDFTKVVDGKVVLDTNKLPRELLQSYGFRIPTSLQMSLSHMEIVGFLPESMGDSLIAPEDFTKQMGSDFDIDKLYAYLYNTVYNKKTGKLAKYTPANVREAKYDSYLAKARKRGDSTIIPKDEFDTTFDEVKLLQNDLLDMRLAVLDNPSMEVQSKIHAAIGFDELKATANRIQKIKDSKRGAELITPLSSEYQNKKYLNGRGGKAGTGVFSSSNTFNSLLQTVSDKMTYNKSMVVKTATGFRKVWVPTNIIFTESKGTNLNNPLTSAGGSKGAIHSAFQNASVDNEKEAILEKINVNRHTFSAIVGLIQDGHDENTIAYLINQPIILDYVNELAKYQDATSDERVDNPEAAAFNFIKEKYFNNVDANIMEMYFNHETPISMIDMVKSLELEDGYDRFTITQINAFAKFSQANDMGRTLQSMASTLNTDSAGLGKDFFSLYTKKGKLEKLVDPEKIPQVSNKELLIDSINGYASEAVDLALDLFGSLFPVNNQAFNAIWSNFREDNQKVEDMDSDTQAAVVSNIFENFKSFIVATEFNKLLEENNSSLEAERQRLLIDTDTNKSFANITKIYQSRIKNPIVIRLSTKIVKDGKSISQVFFDASKGERLDESEMYQAYIDMLNSDNVITEINGQPYTEKDYARDLATYYFITGGVFNPKSFGKFIANNYMEAIGLSENLRTVNFENEVYFSDFYRQYMQNNPYRATKLTSDNDIIVKSSVLKSGNTIVGFKTTDFSGKYIMLDDNNLYEFNADLDYYNLIPQLGSQFASEYYPTRFVENTNKTIVHLSAYPENKLPIELTKPVQTTATEEIKAAGLLESPLLTLGLAAEMQVANEIYSKLGNKTQSRNVEIPGIGDLKDVKYDAKTFWSEVVYEARAQFGDQLIIAYRGKRTNTFLQNYKGRLSGDPSAIIGNPFDFADEVGTRKEQGIRSTKKFIEWMITGNNFGNENATEEYRQAIIEDIKNGKLKNRPIIYYQEKRYATHATALDYLVNQYDWSTTQKPVVKETEVKSTVSKGVEISSNAKGLAAALTNPTELAKSKGNLEQSYPIYYQWLNEEGEAEDANFKDVEEAYQKLKDSSEAKTKPSKEDSNNYKLMVDLITTKLKQHPRLVSEITKQGGSEWILSSTHQPTKQNTIWETGGQNWFIEALNDAYTSIVPTTKPVVEEVEKTITYTPIGKKEQTYTIKGNEIFNKKGEKVFTKDSKDRNRIFANLAVQEGRAVVVDWKNNKYVVNNKGQIISVATGDIMKWPANNGDRIGILDEAQKKFEAKGKPVVGAKTVNTVVNPIEKPVTGQSGLDSRTEAEKAREIKSINNKIVASTTTLDSLGFEKSMDNIDLSVALLNLYKDTSLSESNRSVALLLNRALEGNNVKFRFESLGANAEVGKYDHTTNTVTINSDSNVSKGDMLENILHELTHSVTSRAIKSVLGKLKTPYEYTTAQKAAVLNLEKLYDYTRELILSGKLEQFGYSAEELKNFEAEVAKKIADKNYNPKYDIATFDKYYGISMFANREKKVEEFVAMAMSNKNFQVVLNSVQAPKSDMTLMDKFIEQIKKIVEGFLTSFKITLDTGEKVDLNKDNLLFESLKNIVVLSMDSKENYMETTDIGSLFGAAASPFGEYEATDEDIDSISDEEANDYKLNC